MQNSNHDNLYLLPESKLVSKDLLPSKDSERTISPMDLMWVWVGMSILLTTFAVGASLYPSLSITQILLSVALGNSLVCIVLALTGDIGITHGIPFAVYLRICYGYFGTHIPSIIRSIPAMFWLGFQTWLGAEAINIILMRTIGWPGTIPYLYLLIILFLAVQIYTTAKGVEAIRWFEKFVAPIMLIIGLYMLYWVLKRYGLSFNEIINTPAGPVEGVRYSFAYAITAMTGYWATMSLNIPDFTRYLIADRKEGNWWKRNWGSIWSQFVGVVPTMVFFAFIGSSAMVATGEWNPVMVIANMDAPFGLTIIALICAALAQWSTNIGANILPPANIFANVFAPKIDFAKGCFIAGIIALVMRPWALAHILIPVFAYISLMLGGIAGTMITDYYILRGRKINLSDLYDKNGQYKYFKNYNPAGYIAYVIGFVIGLYRMDLGFIVAGFASGISYFLLMRYWIAIKYPQPEILEKFNIGFPIK